MKENKIADRGICTLCSTCALNSRSHYLHKKLIISYCECRNLGGLYLGFCETPYWQLYAEFSKDEFLEYAQSARAYVEAMRDMHLQSENASNSC